MWLPSTDHQNPATATTIRTSTSSSFGLGYHDDILRHGYRSSNKHTHATSTLAALNYYLERGERRSSLSLSSSSMLGRDYINNNIISSSSTTASAAAANAAPYSSSRWCPTPEQLRTLEDLYRRGIRTPTTHQIQQITGQLRKYGKIEGKNVFYWFQNHKARERQKIKRKLSMSMCTTTPMTTNGHYDMMHRQRHSNNLYCHDHQYCYPMIDQPQYGRFEEKNSPAVIVRGTGLEAEQTKSSWTAAATTINHTLPKPPHFLQDTNVTTLLPSAVTATGETERDVWMPLLLDSSTTHQHPRNSNLPVVKNSNNEGTGLMWNFTPEDNNNYYPCCRLNTITTHQTHSSSSNSTLVDMSGKLDSGSNSIGIPDEHQNTPKKTLHLFPVVVIGSEDDNDDYDDDKESNAPSTSTVDDSDGHAPMNFFQFLPLKG